MRCLFADLVKTNFKTDENNITNFGFRYGVSVSSCHVLQNFNGYSICSLGDKKRWSSRQVTELLMALELLPSIFGYVQETGNPAFFSHSCYSGFLSTRPSWPIRCDVWIVERMRYRPTNRLTDTASYRGALSHLKTDRQSTRWHEMHTQKNMHWKKETPIYDFFHVGDSRLYWYISFQLR